MSRFLLLSALRAIAHLFFPFTSTPAERPHPGTTHMTLAQAVEVIRPSVVQIALQAEHPPHPLGTGFLVSSDGYLITARHVIAQGRTLLDQIQADPKPMLAGLAMPNIEGPPVSFRGSFYFVDLDLVDEDERHDLALLKLRRNPFKDPIRLAKLGEREILLQVSGASLSIQKP